MTTAMPTASTNPGGFARPMPKARWPVVAAILLILYFIAFFTFAILTQRGLVADGSHYFIRILRERTVVSPEKSRWFANLLTEWPILLAVRSHIKDLPTLSYLYSFGLFYLSAVTPVLSWFLLPTERKGLITLPLLALLFGWMASCYAAIGQSQVMALWFWPTAFALAFSNAHSTRAAAVTLLLAIPTILMHEAMCFLGPILAIIALSRIAGDRKPFARCFWFGIGLWMLAGCAIALYFTLFSYKHPDRMDFVTGLVRFHFVFWAPQSVNPPVVVAVAAALAMLFCCIRERPARALLPLWLPAFALFLFAAGFAPVIAPGFFAPQLQYDARSWVVAVPLLLVVAVVAIRLRLLPVPSTARPMLAMIVALTAVSQITWQVAATAKWDQFVDDFRQVLATDRGFVPYDTAFGSGTTNPPSVLSLLVTDWTLPSLSIALAPQGHVSSIVGNPGPILWQPFDPADPAALPRIAGVDYTAYLDALPLTRP